jgi:flotillin
MEELISILAVIGVVGAGAGTALVALARNLLFICEPNEVLIFSGLRGGGSGYRTVKGGRAWRVPLLETVDRLDLTNMIIDVAVTNAYSLGGIPLTVQGVANVKIAGHDPVLGNAVERMLGKERDDVARIAKEVLEGNLRGVLSRLTPEEVNEDKLAFAEKLLDEAEPDLARLGLVLDTMKIQNVSDERGYLDSIGRQKSAEIIKKSRVAEANAKARAIIQDSENRRRARLKELASDTEIAQAQAERRVADAKTRGKAMVAEQIGQVEAMIAKAEGALEAEEARVERVRRQLEADVIEPARADMEAGIASAKGRAAKILEEGRATVLVLREMVAVWQAAGPNARDIFLMQKFQAVLDALVQTINTVKVDKLTMLPGNSDSTATRAVQLVEELKGALGVDLPQMLADVTSGQAQAQLPDRKL